MPTVRLSFSPAPAHVRTARLVGVAVARRAGVAEELLEEVRLAIGEACSRAVALHRSHGLDDLVDVAMADGDRFTVRVVDRAANGAVVHKTPQDDAVVLLSDPALPLTTPPDLLAEEAVAARMGLALLAGLVDDLNVSELGEGIGTEVRMSWPLERSSD
ncbi:ATP-binding protein [Dactylosporangium matsuzakiense]|uniref:Anti-sigma regulatory factor n=1 Tax=Dactylosporangium matsuzakiense TaxID=53360 RepID=A0A9W6NJA1_9ACTN|nr:ATP-binding protein [Dactylosporangium matsuzakiense]UWZ45199.1 ATP-binding protein [Dactylosporangium matsuzakiense]GLK98842.1 anti-sigma regulatory factor [Dactylosporangium matsuzakiense]